MGDVTVPRLVSIDPDELGSPAFSSPIDIPKAKRIKVEVSDVSPESKSKKDSTVIEASGTDGSNARISEREKGKIRSSSVRMH